MPTETSLAIVERYARSAAAARASFEDEIRRARANGCTLREIAKAAGLSPERVRTITKEQK